MTRQGKRTYTHFDQLLKCRIRQTIVTTPRSHIWCLVLDPGLDRCCHRYNKERTGEPAEEQGKAPQTIIPVVATLQALVTAVCQQHSAKTTPLCSFITLWTFSLFPPNEAFIEAFTSLLRVVVVAETLYAAFTKLLITPSSLKFTLQNKCGYIFSIAA